MNVNDKNVLYKILKDFHGYYNTGQASEDRIVFLNKWMKHSPQNLQQGFIVYMANVINILSQIKKKDNPTKNSNICGGSDVVIALDQGKVEITMDLIGYYEPEDRKPLRLLYFYQVECKEDGVYVTSKYREWVDGMWQLDVTLADKEKLDSFNDPLYCINFITGYSKKGDKGEGGYILYGRRFLDGELNKYRKVLSVYLRTNTIQNFEKMFNEYLKIRFGSDKYKNYRFEGEITNFETYLYLFDLAPIRQELLLCLYNNINTPSLIPEIFKKKFSFEIDKYIKIPSVDEQPSMDSRTNFQGSQPNQFDPNRVLHFEHIKNLLNKGSGVRDSNDLLFSCNNFGSKNNDNNNNNNNNNNNFNLNLNNNNVNFNPNLNNNNNNFNPNLNNNNNNFNPNLDNNNNNFNPNPNLNNNNNNFNPNLNLNPGNNDIVNKNVQFLSNGHGYLQFGSRIFGGQIDNQVDIGINVQNYINTSSDVLVGTNNGDNEIINPVTKETVYDKFVLKSVTRKTILVFKLGMDIYYYQLDGSLFPVSQENSVEHINVGGMRHGDIVNDLNKLYELMNNNKTIFSTMGDFVDLSLISSVSERTRDKFHLDKVVGTMESDEKVMNEITKKKKSDNESGNSRKEAKLLKNLCYFIDEKNVIGFDIIENFKTTFDVSYKPGMTPNEKKRTIVHLTDSFFYLGLKDHARRSDAMCFLTNMTDLSGIHGEIMNHQSGNKLIVVAGWVSRIKTGKNGTENATYTKCVFFSISREATTILGWVYKFNGRYYVKRGNDKLIQTDNESSVNFILHNLMINNLAIFFVIDDLAYDMLLDSGLLTNRLVIPYSASAVGGSGLLNSGQQIPYKSFFSFLQYQGAISNVSKNNVEGNSTSKKDFNEKYISLYRQFNGKKIPGDKVASPENPLLAIYTMILLLNDNYVNQGEFYNVDKNNQILYEIIKFYTVSFSNYHVGEGRIEVKYFEIGKFGRFLNIPTIYDGYLHNLKKILPIQDVILNNQNWVHFLNNFRDCAVLHSDLLESNHYWDYLSMYHKILWARKIYISMWNKMFGQIVRCDENYGKQINTWGSFQNVIKNPMASIFHREFRYTKNGNSLEFKFDNVNTSVIGLITNNHQVSNIATQLFGNTQQSVMAAKKVRFLNSFIIAYCTIIQSIVLNGATINKALYENEEIAKLLSCLYENYRALRTPDIIGQNNVFTIEGWEDDYCNYSNQQRLNMFEGFYKIQYECTEVITHIDNKDFSGKTPKLMIQLFEYVLCLSNISLLYTFSGAEALYDHYVNQVEIEYKNTVIGVKNNYPQTPFVQFANQYKNHLIEKQWVLRSVSLIGGFVGCISKVIRSRGKQQNTGLQRLSLKVVAINFTPIPSLGTGPLNCMHDTIENSLINKKKKN